MLNKVTARLPEYWYCIACDTYHTIGNRWQRHLESTRHAELAAAFLAMPSNKWLRTNTYHEGSTS